MKVSVERSQFPRTVTDLALIARNCMISILSFKFNRVMGAGVFRVNLKFLPQFGRYY